MNKKSSAVIGALIAASAAWAGGVAGANAEPPSIKDATRAKMTPAGAVSAAKTFCEDAGVTLTQPGVAEFLGMAPDEEMPATYWRPTWRVHFGGVEVELCDTDGVITSFMAADQGDDKPAGKAISKAAALKKALRVLAATHTQDTLGIPDITESQFASPPKQDTHMWDVFWSRQARGFSMSDQHASVSLIAETGALAGMRLMFPTAIPPAVNPVLTSAQATAKAVRFLQSQKRFDGAPWIARASELTWITPYTQARTPPVNGVVNAAPKPVQSVALAPILSWSCQLVSEGNGYAIVPVNCVDGEIVTYGLGFADGPARQPRTRRAALPSPVLPPPARVVIAHDIAAIDLPGGVSEPIPSGSAKYKLTIADIYAPLSTLTDLGFSQTDGTDLGGNEETDETIARKLIDASHCGKLRLIAGPSAIVPLKGVWCLYRTRESVCKDRIFWDPRPVPETIEMKLSITPMAMGPGELMFDCDQGNKALADGEKPSIDASFDDDQNGTGFGHENAWTLLSSANEEEYCYTTRSPGEIKCEGVKHIVLIKAEKAP